MNTDATTFSDLFSAYGKAAKIERTATGLPAPSTVGINIGNAKTILERCHLKMDAPLSSLTRHILADYVVRQRESGRPTISIKSEMDRLNALFARWTGSHYEYLLPEWTGIAFRFPTPHVRATPQHYTRPTRERLMAVKAWYAALWGDSAREGIWLAATFMMEFAMRNGDIERLTWDNLIEKDAHIFLCYTPHKTRFSSGRTVLWPIHDAIWRRLEAIRRKSRSRLILPGADKHIARITRDMRKMGFQGSKGAYELRKICIDHIYQHYGAEMATSISGDNLRTILRYYADPTTLNVVGVRVFDLIR